jgi:molybdopterin converting factor small subunit
MVMKIFIDSNFVVPGLEDKEGLEIDQPEITLREFLEKLSSMSSDRIEYVEPGAHALDPSDWEVEINDLPYQDYKAGLEHPIKDGDTVTIRIVALGGG